MALFSRACPLFFSLMTLCHALPHGEAKSPPSAGKSHLFSAPSKEFFASLMEELLKENPHILATALGENPEILASVFSKNPHILWDAQQKMIADFSEHASENVYKHTEKILSNSPELWGQLQKKPLRSGKKHIILFLDPLCPHSMALLKDTLTLSSGENNNNHAPCPHFVTKHQDIRAQMIARSLVAAHALGKLEAFLEILISRIHQLSAELAQNIALELGLNRELFQKHMFSSHADEALLNARAYANQFQFQGLPTILYKRENSGESRRTEAGSQERSFELIEGHPDTLESLMELLSH